MECKKCITHTYITRTMEPHSCHNLGSTVRHTFALDTKRASLMSHASLLLRFVTPQRNSITSPQVCSIFHETQPKVIGLEGHILAVICTLVLRPTSES